MFKLSNISLAFLCKTLENYLLHKGRKGHKGRKRHK